MYKIIMSAVVLILFMGASAFGAVRPDYRFSANGHCLQVNQSNCLEMKDGHLLVVYYDAINGMSIDDVVGPQYSGMAWVEHKRVSMKDDVWGFIYKYRTRAGRKANYKGIMFFDNMWVLNADGKKDTLPTSFSFLDNGPVEWVEYTSPRELDEEFEPEPEKPKGPKIEEFYGFQCEVRRKRRFLVKDPTIEILPNGTAVREDVMTKLRIRVNPYTGEEIDPRPTPIR